MYGDNVAIELLVDSSRLLSRRDNKANAAGRPLRYTLSISLPMHVKNNDKNDLAFHSCLLDSPSLASFVALASCGTLSRIVSSHVSRVSYFAESKHD